MMELASVWPQAVAKAWMDEMFRQELLRDAGAALKSHFALDLPGDLALSVVEQGAASATTLVLPPRPDDLDDGLVELDKPDDMAPQCCCCC